MKPRRRIVHFLLGAGVTPACGQAHPPPKFATRAPEHVTCCACRNAATARIE